MERTPEEQLSAETFWEAYRFAIYGHEGLPHRQEIETSLAFYAGMEATFKTMEIMSDNDDISDLEIVKRLQTFRRRIGAASIEANLNLLKLLI